MLLHKYTKSTKFDYAILGFEWLGEAGASKILRDNFLITSKELLQANGKHFIQSITDGYYYEYESDEGQSYFTKDVLVDSVVVPECKNGLRIYKDIYDTDPLLTVSVDDHIYMGMRFKTDTNGTIWGNCDVIQGETVTSGYFVYKNNRNRFANTRILDFNYTTVLTNGEIDAEKVSAAKEIGLTKPKTTRAYSLRSVAATASVTTAKAKASTTTTSKKAYTGAVNSEKVTKAQQTLAAKKSGVKLSYLSAISAHAPSIVQNKSNFPKSLGKSHGKYRYDYTLHCADDPTLSNMKSIYEANNITVQSPSAYYKKATTSYNRFKLAHPDETLSRGFMHIFFTRPDLNIYDGKGLTSQCKKDPMMCHMYKYKPALVRILTQSSGSTDFMYFLSNRARGISLSDASVGHDKYGESFMGASIEMARRMEKEGGTFDIQYVDTRDLDIINLHKMWVTYENNVYRGIWRPKYRYMYNKILDYAASVYVIVTAEDFETVLYWCKYYGVFPLNVPYSGLSWTYGDPMTKLDLTITYAYSFREEYNPLALSEFNTNHFKSGSVSKYYNPTFYTDKGRLGNTWVGAPFIESLNYGSKGLPKVDPMTGSSIGHKLRFS